MVPSTPQPAYEPAIMGLCSTGHFILQLSNLGQKAGFN
jgi:hypothetical protein